MTKPVTNSQPSAITFSEDDVQPITVRMPKSASAPTTTEPFRGETHGGHGSGADSELIQMANEYAANVYAATAERNQLKDGIRALSGPLNELASRHPDPLSDLGRGELSPEALGLGRFGDVLRSDAFQAAAARLSPDDVRWLVRSRVGEAWPQLPAADAEKLTAFFNRQIGEAMRDQAAFTMQRTAATMMRDGAKSFEACAKDPKQVAQLAERLNQLAGPGSSLAEQAEAAKLRQGLGLEGDSRTVQPGDLSQAMTARAALMRHEATVMADHGVPSLFRALAKQDLERVIKQQAGIEPGSLLDGQVSAVKERGESEEDSIRYVKLAGSVGIAVATAGFGGVGIGLLTSVLGSAPDVAHAWHAIDVARASESAGTMGAGATAKAKRDAVIETGAAVVEMGLGAAGHGLLHAAEKPISKLAVSDVARHLAHGTVHGVIAWGTGAAEEAVSDSFGAADASTGQNALDRATAK
jgi:hypothetical protein